eukprot:620572_1
MELLFYPSIFVICSALLHISVYCSMKLILSLWYSVAHHSYQSKVGAKSDQHIQSRRDTKNNYMPDCGTTIVPTTKTLSAIELGRMITKVIKLTMRSKYRPKDSSNTENQHRSSV